MDVTPEEREILRTIQDTWQISPERIASTHGLDVAKYEQLFRSFAERGLLELQEKQGEIVVATLTKRAKKHLEQETSSPQQNSKLFKQPEDSEK